MRIKKGSAVIADPLHFFTTRTVVIALTQSNIAGNSQYKYTFFRNNKRDPNTIIKDLHINPLKLIP
jgi:hypothetical protein